MANLNRVFLMGNLTRDPELRYTPNGTAVVNLRIAVNTRFKDQSGGFREETCFLVVVVWGKQAEACNQYLTKGRPVFVEGRLQSRSWETPDGQKRSALEVRADRVQFLGRARETIETEAEPPLTKEEPMDITLEEEIKGTDQLDKGPDEEIPF
jgi:single-strand DNA-binding protein